ncbi:MAG: 2-hydroxyacyl-CoA dehydratase family protein, partial [Desulfobacterales bacterium]|nr:2-hydroxyacyl-CoA dehydratase family protein [Desulfobacterales bacterium]
MELKWKKTLQKKAEQNLLDLEAHKAEGKHVVGFYCLYAPTELAVAAGAVPLTLCGTRHDPIEAAETVLPRNLCPLIKSSYGFAITDTCPFFKFSDLIVADTTCDGKKKTFEIMAPEKPFHVLQLPQEQGNPVLDRAWEAEVYKLKERLEGCTGQSITREKIQAAIGLLNRERRAKKKLMDLARRRPSPIKGSDLIEALFKLSFFRDKEDVISMVDEIVKESDAVPSQENESAPRILVTG